MARKLRIIFGDFLKTAHKLWLEMMGALFLTLAVMFALNTFTAYRRIAEEAWNWRSGFNVFGSAALALMLLAFGIHSFWKVRKIR